MTALSALRGLWLECGGDPAALSQVSLSGRDPVLPSSFHVGAAAQASIAAAGLAAAELWRLRSGQTQQVSVDIRHAALAFQSERHLRIAGREPPNVWDSIAGIYPAAAGRHVRLHTNFAHHRDAVLKVLGCAAERGEVQAALAHWEAADFETAAHAAGGAVAMVRTAEEWGAHPQSAALGQLPLVEITRIGEAEIKPLPPGDTPLAGMRVLDLSRVIAGPVAGRTLAAHGAEVLLISAAHLPSIEWLAIDTGRGKRSARLDLRCSEGRVALASLIGQADFFLQAYRPQALASLGFGPDALAELRPGIIAVSLSAYGRLGPWAGRRGFDSLVQSASGFNAAEAAAFGTHMPKELPAQALDHASGYLLAFGAMMARARQAKEGGSWHVQVSLARTGRWLWDLGRVENGFSPAPAELGPTAGGMEETDSPFGLMRAVRHPVELAVTPARFARPSVPLGHDEPVWTALP